MKFQVSILIDGDWSPMAEPIEATSAKVAKANVRANAQLRQDKKEGCWKVRAV